MRESWLRGEKGFQIDHLVPLRLDRSRGLDYDNLVYTCPWCNRAKAGATAPDPTQIAFGQLISVNRRGEIVPLSTMGAVLAAALKLDAAAITRQRRLVIATLELAEAKRRRDVIELLLEMPGDLLNLKLKRPPEGNSRPEGADRSYFELRRQNKLPASP